MLTASKGGKVGTTVKTKVKRMNLNIEATLHDQFKAATAAQGKNMTDVVLDFIEDYVQKHLPQVSKGSRRQ